MIGKWHLGTDPTGFDRWIVLPGQGGYWNPEFLTPAGKLAIKGHCSEITHKLIHYFKQDSYELFDLVADPHEQHNLLFDEAEAKMPQVAAVFETLTAEVARLQREYRDDGRYADRTTWPRGGVDGDLAGRQPHGAKSVAEAIALSAPAGSAVR